mmetsp:Transcript_11266/g.39954  ORF Transcript_11266/g.39954 Transcript_11266/m.39954 type:complete len:358 (-) Transcript_11266:116-1189(-)
MSDDEDLDDFVPLRPHSAGSKAAAQRPKQRKPFRPKPPSEQRKIEKSLLASASNEETSSSILQDALRRQEAEFGGGAGMSFIPQRFAGMSLKKFGIGDNQGLSSNAQSFSSGGGAVPGMAAPRVTKQRGEGKSLELADLAFTPLRKTKDGIFRTAYTPISLPYFNVTEEDDHSGGGAAASASRKSRPTLHHVDERNSNAAKELFLNDAGDLQEDKFFLIQLPSVLPELVDATEEIGREDGEDAPASSSGAALAPTLARLPDGKIGKLKIYKSGKVRMEIGGVPFCVDQGAQTFFQQEIGCVCPLAKEYVNLGSIQNRVVLTPDVGALLADLLKAQEARSGAEAPAVAAAPPARPAAF